MGKTASAKAKKRRMGCVSRPLKRRPGRMRVPSGQCNQTGTERDGVRIRASQSAALQRTRLQFRQGEGPFLHLGDQDRNGRNLIKNRGDLP